VWKTVEKQVHVLRHDDVAKKKEFVLLTLEIQVVDCDLEVSLFGEDFCEGDDRRSDKPERFLIGVASTAKRHYLSFDISRSAAREGLRF
jgi:hypothetical protein